MKSAMKFEMMYQARMLSSEIIMAAMKGDPENLDKKAFLQNLKHCRFEAGYYDKNKKAIFTEIKTFTKFEKRFFMEDDCCYTVIEDPSNHLGVRYIVLKENELMGTLHQLRIKIISYLVLSFIFIKFLACNRTLVRPDDQFVVFM